MQVYRLHGAEQIASTAPGRQPASPSATSTSSASDTQEGVSTDNGSAVTALLAQLRSTPEVRQAVVEQARAKVASGDYFTRPSAEATAEAWLSYES